MISPHLHLDYKKDSKIEWFLFVLFLMLPFHTFLTSYFLPTVTGIDKMALAPWREGVVVLLFVYILVHIIKVKLCFKVSLWNLSIFAFIGLGLGMVVGAQFSYISTYGFRNYCFPFAFLFAFYLMPLKNPHLVIKGVLLGAFLATLFGFIQLMLGAKFLLQFGYGENHFLGTAFYIVGGEFQRLVGTFGSPNEFGLFTSMALMIGIYYYGVTKNKWLLLFIAVEMAAVVYTFSRSSWLAAFFATIYLIVTMKLFKFKKIELKNIPKKHYFFIVPGLAAVLFAVYMLVLKIYNYIHITISGKDPSSLGHFFSLVEGVMKVIENPAGFGLGYNGPKAEVVGLDVVIIESSYLLLAFEFGVVGLLLFLLVMYFTIKKFRENLSTRPVNMAITIAFLTGCFFLPQIQSLDVTYFYWSMVGLLLNKNFVIHNRELNG